MVKAIETEYDGYRFRSRLEARWAVFFKTLGIPYEYEKEGFDLDGTRYLPDFWLPEQDCWYEVKGQCPTTEEYIKCKKLCESTGKRVYIADGEIKIPDEGELGEEKVINSVTKLYCYAPPSDSVWNDANRYEADWIYPHWPINFWCGCPWCHKLEILSCYTAGFLTCSCLTSAYKQYLLNSLNELSLRLTGADMEEVENSILPEFRGKLKSNEEFVNEQIKIKENEHVYNFPLLINAYKAARQARFEHGEKP